MLTELSIQNVAIIESLRLSLKPGLTMLTGETGAGKSIIIDAVGLIMGSRASSDLIRSGEEEAVVEALFDISALPGLAAQLEESGFECDGELLIKRSISRSGKNRVFINGSMATLGLLTDIAAQLINIYGQHESQTLLKPENQLQLLDSFAGAAELRGRFAAAYREFQAVQEQLARMDELERETARKLDLLTFQSEEIEGMKLAPGEDIKLEEQRRLLSNAGRLGGSTAESFERLYGGDGAITGQLQRISHTLRDLSSIDPSLAEIADSIENSYLQLEDAAMSLRSYAARIEADPDALQSVEDRLDQIGRLKRKYGSTVEEIIAFKEQVDRELQQLREQGQSRQQLASESERLAGQVSSLGNELSKQRRTAAARLKQALEKEAHQLAMKNAVIEAAVTTMPEARPTGFDKLELLFSPNPGESPRPLAKIASGGELSRLMLAFKQVLPEGDAPTLVFDEVDTGIGGATSEIVGRKLKKVASSQQVFCITHLPQVAVFADQHLRVEKQVENGRTATTVNELDLTGRTEEVARMLGGSRITDTTRQHAREMLTAAAGQSQLF